MGKLALIALLAACGNNNGGGDDVPDAATLAKCGDGHVDPGEQCDDGNSIPNDGCTLCMIDAQRMAAIDATWTLSTVAGDVAPCPSGFDTAAVIATPVDSNGTATGAPLVSLLDCSAGMGTSAKLPAMTYSAKIAITNHAMSQTFATSDPQPVDLDRRDRQAARRDVRDRRRQVRARLEARQDVGRHAGDVRRGRLDGARESAWPTTVRGWPRARRSRVPPAWASRRRIVAGTYTVTVSISNNVFTTKGVAAVLTGQVIVAPNGVTDLGTISIPVTAL